PPLLPPVPGRRSSDLVDGIEQSVTESLSSLGLNTFDIYSRTYRRSNREGVVEKTYPLIRYSEARRFMNEYTVPSSVCIFAHVSRSEEHTSELQSRENL